MEGVYLEGVCHGGGLHGGGLPGGGLHGGGRPPLRYAKIRSTGGRYASYWNAFLYQIECIVMNLQLPSLFVTNDVSKNESRYIYIYIYKNLMEFNFKRADFISLVPF